MSAITQYDHVSDTLENTILLALEAHQQHSEATDFGSRKSNSGQVWTLHDQGNLLGFCDMSPASMYMFDMVDSDRLIATHPEYLMAHPAEIVGAQSEVAFHMPDGSLRWRGVRRLKARPKRVSVLGKATHYYELHGRDVYPSGEGSYFKRMIALDKCGLTLTTSIGGGVLCAADGATFNICFAASAIEDAHRSGAMLASVKDAAEIKFPVPLDDYKAVFANREGPMAGTRRKAIIHWVAQHLRRPENKKPHTVKRHIRGVNEITLDGLRIQITPNG